MIWLENQFPGYDETPWQLTQGNAFLLNIQAQTSSYASAVNVSIHHVNGIVWPRQAGKMKALKKWADALNAAADSTKDFTTKVTEGIIDTDNRFKPPHSMAPRDGRVFDRRGRRQY